PRRAAGGLDDRQLVSGRGLQGHLGARRGRLRARARAGTQPATAAPARRPLRRLAVAGPAAAAVMLARIAHELFWLGRDMTRAEHTARMLDGAFHADVAGGAAAAGAGPRSGIALSW